MRRTAASAIFALVSAMALAGCTTTAGSGLEGSLAASEVAAGRAALTSTATPAPGATSSLPPYQGVACPDAVVEKTRDNVAGKGTVTVENFATLGGPAADPALIAGDTPSCVLRVTEGAVSIDEYLFIGMDEQYADAFDSQLPSDGFTQKASNTLPTGTQTEFIKGTTFVQILFYPPATSSSVPLTVVQSSH
jgi:hypothetical protein